nr:Cna B-type domain-containing protein [Lachnospiraceae bacterium]
MRKRNNKVAVLVKKAVALTLTTTMLLSGTGGLNLWSSLNVLAEDVEPSNELNAPNDAPSTDDSQSAPKSVSEDLHQTTQLSFHIAWDDGDSQGRFRPGLDALKEDFRSALSAHPLRGKNQSEYDENQDDLAGKKDAIDVSIQEDESGWNVTYSNVPLFILEGTGNQTTSNGDNTYQVDHYVLHLSGLSIPGYTIHEDLVDFRTRLESPNDVAFISDSPSVSISLNTSLFASAMERTVTWNDNVDVNGQRPKDTDFLSLHYTVGGSEYAIASSGEAGGDAQGVTTVTAQEAKEALGALDASVFTPDVTRPEVDTHWDLTWKYLPKEDPNGNTIEYSLHQRQVPEFYLSSLGNGTGVVVDGDVTYTFSDKFSVTVTWNDAAEKDHRLQNLKDLNLSIYQKTASSVKEIYNTKEEVPSGLDDSDIEWPTSYEGNSWTLTVPSLKGYDENNATNTYFVKVKAPDKISGEDWEYEVTYDNGLSSNETGRAYSNGDVLINLKGDTTYQATKVFQVVNLDKEAAASNVTFRLWCYPNNKTADAMSAVTVGGNQLTYKPKAEDIVSCDKGEYKEKGYAQINLNGNCFKQDALDRFDALGYELKYCVTEDPSDLYTVVYPGQANVLENGEVMSNILAHQKIFKVRKIWNSQGYDAFKHTKVTLKLQKSVNGVDWTDADRKAEFSGFTSSVVAKEKSLSPVSKFEDGQELSFRVIEELTYNGKKVSIDNWTENGQTLSATYRLDGKEYAVTIRRDGDTFTAFNEVSSKLTLHLKKVWGNSASASWGEEDKKEGSKLVRKKRGFSLTVSRAKQGGTPEEYARVNVAVSDDGVEVTAKNKAGESMDLARVYQPEVSAEEWDLADLSVPRSDEGYVYDYYVSETFPEMEGAGIYKMVTYRILEQPQDGLDTGDMIATVTNSIYSGTGEYHEIHVKKTWNDNSDVEGRGDVIATIGIWKKNGETWSFEKPSDLLEQGQDIEATLKAGNNYSQIVNVTDLYIPERYKDNSKGAEYATALKDGSDRIRLGVLESGIIYQNQRFASGTGYSYGQKKSDLTGEEAWIAEGVISGGMVNGALCSGYDFTVEEKDGEYTITNTKSGKVEITATIEWKDGGYGKYRQYGWGVALYYVNQNGSDVPFKGEDGQQLVAEDIDSSVTAENAYKTSKEPQKGEDNVNYYKYNDLTFHDLPMYDRKGRLYTYSVHEYIKDKDGQRVELSITDPASDLKKTHYTATGVDDGDLRELTPTLQENVLTQPYEVSFHHKAGGTSVDTTYYTIWYDQARITKPQTYGKRVLAAYKLFYKMSDSSSDTLTKYDQRMVRNTVSAEEGADNNYYQKVMFSGMPEFDDNGNHYEYYAQQQLLNNPSGDAGYTTEYYKKSAVKKNPAVDRTGTPAFDLEDVTIASRCEAGDDPDGVPLPENGLFVNRIHGKLKISGTKEWKDMPDDTKTMGYPDIEVSLKKKSDYDRDDTPIEATINKARSKYHFETTEGEERAFDKFDRYGAPYTYVLTEKMYLPGTKRPINSHLYHSLMNGDTNTENTYDLSGDYVLNNYYSLEGAKRDITIHKSWNENTPAEGHPKATFRLYRSAVDIADMADDDDGGKKTIANILKDAGKLKAYADKKEQVTGFTVGEEENRDVITFAYDKTKSTEEKTVTNLPIYATNGQLYLYFLEEDTMVDSQEGLPGFQPNYSEEDTDYEYKKDMGLVVFKNQNLSTGTASLGDTGKEIETLHISDAVHVENSFDSDTVREITGVKKWAENTVDKSIDFETYVKEKIRPQISNGSLSGVILKLYRALGGKTEEISSNQYDLVWSDQDGAYCYSIKPKDGYSFPKYNEDGRAYTYQVVEEMSDTGYVKTNYSGTEKVSKNAASTDDKNVLTMDALTNTLKGGLKVNKWWNDGRDAYLLRDVTLKIDLEAYEEGKSQPVFVLTHDMSKEDKWVYTYKNLPLVTSNGTKLTYKVKEKTIGSDIVEELQIQQDDKGFKFWGKTKNYQVAYKDHEGLSLTEDAPVASTEITNKLTGTSLDIVKKWANDSKDFYARPKELRFKLQYRVVKWNESDGKVTGFEEEWQDSQSNASSDNKSVIITMKASDQDKENSILWKKTVSNLPKTVMVDGSAKFVQYRAVELDQDPDGKDKVLNLNDSMDSYTLTAQNDHEN